MGEDAHKLGDEVPVTSSAPLSLPGSKSFFFNRFSLCLRKSAFPNTSDRVLYGSVLMKRQEHQGPERYCAKWCQTPPHTPALYRNLYTISILRTVWPLLLRRLAQNLISVSHKSVHRDQSGGITSGLSAVRR